MFVLRYILAFILFCCSTHYYWGWFDGLWFLTPFLILWGSLSLFQLIWFGYSYRRKKIAFWIMLLAVITCLPLFLNNFNGAKSEPPMTENLRVASYNVRLFNKYHWKGNLKTHQEITNFLEAHKVNLACLQELPKNSTYKFSKYQKTSKLKKQPHLGIYTSFPIVDSMDFDLIGETGTAIYSALKITETDTLHVINFHLESLFLPNWKKPWNRQINKNKFAISFLQTQQMDRVINFLETKKKVLICGDMNNTPNSRIYHQMASYYSDTFLEKGQGIGQTYSVYGFPLRIDYVFVSPKIKTRTFKTVARDYSDHNPILVTLKI